MKNIRLNEVFGNDNSDKLLTYIKREAVDDEFFDALQSHKQIMIYGSSKQGKTTLLKQYINYDGDSDYNYVLYSVNTKTDLADIYKTVLQDAGLKIDTSYTSGEGQKDSTTIAVRAKIVSTRAINFDNEEFNITEPQNIATYLKKLNQKDKIIILENFHYLTLENQRKFAFDLRTFQDLKIKFIILGVWRDKNKLALYNGDLLDRVYEIPVEPWDQKDFEKVIKTGEEKLNIQFSDESKNLIMDMSFSSIGVLQDLLHLYCSKSKIRLTQTNKVTLDDINILKHVFKVKADTYGTRHKNVLKAIADNNTTLNLPYYIIQKILHTDVDKLEIGLSFQSIVNSIKRQHPNKNIKDHYIKESLEKLSFIQSDKKISPPILMFDSNANLLHITDSTLYFWMKNTNIKQFKQDLKTMYSN